MIAVDHKSPTNIRNNNLATAPIHAYPIHNSYYRGC